MSNYSNPAGEDMDDMNELREKLDQEQALYDQAFRMVDPKDIYGQLYIPTIAHVKILVRRIKELNEQLKLKEVLENQDPY